MTRWCLVTIMVFAATPAGAQVLLVLERGDDRAAVIDMVTGRVLWRAAVGPNPHELAAAPDGNRVFVSSYGGHTVHAVEPAQRRTAPLALEGYTRLHGIWVARTEPTVWVTAEDQQAVLEVNAATGEVLRSWHTGQQMSHMVVGTQDDAKLYVANIRSGSVTVINRSDSTTVVVPTGAGAEGIDIAPDGGEVWVSNNADNTISVIDTKLDAVVATFSSEGLFPVKLRFTPDGAQVWVSNNRSGTVAVFDARTRRHLGDVPAGVRPLGIGFSPDNRYGFVTVPGTNEVVQVDRRDRTIVRRVATGRGPDGVLWLAPGPEAFHAPRG